MMHWRKSKCPFRQFTARRRSPEQEVRKPGGKLRRELRHTMVSSELRRSEFGIPDAPAHVRPPKGL
eukprot:6203773-Pleurochrysis_carterae.AAC.3